MNFDAANIALCDCFGHMLTNARIYIISHSPIIPDIIRVDVSLSLTAFEMGFLNRTGDLFHTLQDSVSPIHSMTTRTDSISGNFIVNILFTIFDLDLFTENLYKFDLAKHIANETFYKVLEQTIAT